MSESCCCKAANRDASAPDDEAPPARLAAVILAAGYSSRMGGFKPLLPLGDRTVVERAIALFRQAGIREIGVVLGHRAEELAPTVERMGADWVLNPRHAEGMYSSVVAGIGALASEVEGCFLLPVDIPLVRPSTVRRLAEGFRAETPILYPTFRGRHGHPPLISRSLFGEILSGDGSGGLKRSLGGHAAEAEDLDVFDEGVLLDMDTPEDYARLRERATRADYPTAAECEAILASLGVAEPVIRHSRAVAGVALRLAQRLDMPDRDLALAGALLHDIAKGSPNHGQAGARIVAGLGYPEVARIVATHSDLAFSGGAPDAAALVYLADKLVQGDALVSVEARFQPALTRFADDSEALRAATGRLETAGAIAAAVEDRLGVGLDDVLARDPISPVGGDATAEPRRVAVLGTTESVCPICLRRISAQRVAEDGSVYLCKSCPTHGDFKTAIWRGPPAYGPWGRTAAAFSRPTVCATGTDRGCPFDCGLCPDHRQQSCCVLLEVTQRCNLSCPVCFAASGRAAADPGLEEIESWLRMLRSTGRTVNIQLSGGEPTLRDDLPEIVALARSFGFGFVQVNTNGLRLAADLPYLRRLQAAGLDCVFLQFDGVTDAVYRQIRGRNLLAVKDRAIRNCAELKLGVVLVPVLVPGVNTAQIGDIIRFAIDRMPTVRTVHFQPISYFGRFPHPPEDRDRITIPEVLRQIEAQTGRRIKAADFRPGTAENPYCSFNGEFAVRADGEIAAVRSPVSSCRCGEADAAEAADEAEQARRFVARRWAASAEPQASCCGDGIRVDSLDAFLEDRKRVLCISGMAFQDAWTLDLDRLRQCYIHVVSPDRRLVPLCAYNLSGTDGKTLYSRPDP